LFRQAAAAEVESRLRVVLQHWQHGHWSVYAIHGIHCRTQIIITNVKPLPSKLQF